MEILNTTNLTFDEMADLILQRVSNKKKMIISAISSIVLLAIVILNWDSNSMVAYILMCCLLGIGLILSILVIITEKWIFKKSNKSLENGVVYKYVFKDKDFTVTSITNTETKSLTFTYQSLSKIVITNDNIYLYPTSVSIYCVKLTGFEDENQKREVIDLLSPYQTKK
jgi:hypothetical protein